MLVSVGLSNAIVPNAFAQGSGSSVVCGLMLCSEYSGGRAAYEENWVMAFLNPNPVSKMHHDDTRDTALISPHNADAEFAAKLDVFIHKFELDKISAQEALDEIVNIHNQYKSAGITSDIIEAVDEKIALINSGKLSGAAAVEAIHLTAEPQNVDPEYIGALDEYLHKFELNQLSADESIAGVIEVHDELTLLHVSSDLVDTVGIQINIYRSGEDSAEHILEKIRNCFAF